MVDIVFAHSSNDVFLNFEVQLKSTFSFPFSERVRKK